MYLLKQGAKPVPERRKRRKIEVFELPSQESQKQEEVKQEGPGFKPPPGDFKDITDQVMMSRRSKRPTQDH